MKLLLTDSGVTNPSIHAALVGMLGWKSVGVLELTALPSIDADRWVPLVKEADVLLVAGGDVLYRPTGCGSPG